MRDLLFEIGTEELPASFVEPARRQLATLAARALEEHRVSFSRLATYATPRRLALYGEDIAARQEDWAEEVKGPPQEVAYDDGQPCAAALGFARSQAVDVADLVVRDTPQGKYVYARKVHQGQDTGEILPELLTGLVRSLAFPRFMYWEASGFTFARPIRWLVALYGGEIIEVAIGGVRAGRISRGLRFFGPDEVEITSPAAYVETMRQAYVIVDPDERCAIIERQAQDLAGTTGGRIDENPELLAEVVNLGEYPTAFIGSFSSEYLHLPEEVLLTVIQRQQRYFCVREASGKLLPRFIGVRNGPEENIEVVRAGNERVLRARLTDAAFFYHEDLKESLTSKVEKLHGIIFQEQMGTMYEKGYRIQYLGRMLARQLELPRSLAEVIVDAAYLAKADLVSHMVGEFPELQGIMGSYYAARQGERPEVCAAIREHYLPRAAGDALPRSEAGMVLALADKLDTLVGYFSLGFQPTGSQDPYGLRRLGTGICLIIIENELPLSIREIVTEAYSQYRVFGRPLLSLEDTVEQVQAFLLARLENICQERGIAYDIVDAVTAVARDDLADAWQRIQALTELQGHHLYDQVLTVFNRVWRLGRQAATTKVNPDLFEHPTETRLYRSFQQARAQATACMKVQDYRSSLRLVATLYDPVARFFDDVLVMADAPDIRENRLGLLRLIAEYIREIADFTRIAA